MSHRRYALAVVVLLVACDDKPNPHAISDLSNALPVSDFSTQQDMAVAAESDLAGPEVFSTGAVDVFGYTYSFNSSTSSGYGATASFTTTTYLPGLSCAISTVGNCQVRNCNGNLFSATQTDDSVGPFSFTVSGNTFTFTSDIANNYSYSPRSPPPSPSPGAAVAVNFQGLPLVNVVEPDVVTIVSPSPDPLNPTVVKQNSDFSVYLAGGTAGSTATMRLSAQTMTQSVLLTCTSDPSTGKVTAPTAALQIVPAGSGSVSLQVAGKSAPVQVMGHTTTVTASTTVLDPNHNASGGLTITLQPQ